MIRVERFMSDVLEVFFVLKTCVTQYIPLSHLKTWERTADKLIS